MAMISVLKLHNFAAIEEAEYKLGRVVLIHGKNAQGKSSIVNSLNYLFEGSHEAKLIRAGQEEGLVGVVLSNGVELQRKLKPSSNSNKIKVRDEEGTRVQRPAAFIEELLGGQSIDPMAFLNQTPKEQVATYLRSIPMTISNSDIRLVTAREDLTIDENAHAITEIARIRDILYDERTAANKDMKTQETFCKKLREALPEDFDEEQTSDGLRTELAEARAKLDKRKAAKLERETQITKKHMDAINELERTSQERIAAIREEANKKAVELNKKSDAELQALREKADPAIDSAKEQVMTLEKQLDEQTRNAATAENLKQARETLATYSAKQSKTQMAIDNLDKFKNELLDSEKGEDVQVTSEGLLIRGVAVSQLSKAESIEFAVDVSARMLNGVKTIVTDNGECMDSEHFEALVNYCQKKKTQIIVCMVTDEDGLSVDSAKDTESAIALRNKAKAALK